MSWATSYIAALERGETVTFRPSGNSMVPKIKSGQLVTVEPVPHAEIQKGDIVLCRIGRAEYLHLVRVVHDNKKTGTRMFTIQNNHGRINGVTSHVFGRVTKVE